MNNHVSRARLGLQAALLLLTPVLAQSAILLEHSFTNATAWSGRYGYVYPIASGVTVPYPAIGAYGTIDTRGSTTNSPGLLLSVNSANATGYWEAGVISGLLPSASAGIAASELTPEKVSISFDCWANQSRPVVVMVESFTANNAASRNGSSQAVIYPAAAKFYQRKVLELDQFTTVGTSGAFKPGAPYYRITFRIDSTTGGRGWPKTAGLEVRLDNINISNPALYVDASIGRDWYYDSAENNQTSTEARPFETIRGAVGKAKAGDIILVKGGGPNYRNYYYNIQNTNNINYYANDTVVSFNKGGAPSKWLVLKNYPSDNPADIPVLESSGNQCVEIGTSDAGANVAYIEVRGFEMKGVAEQLDLADPGANDDPTRIKGTSASGANTSGVFVRGNIMANKPHHIRIADNRVHDCPGAGIASWGADWFSIEDNEVFENSWWGNSAASGISMLLSYDFPGVSAATTNDYRMLISGNRVYRNETRKRWDRTNGTDNFSDGNGIIYDKNRNVSGSSDVTYPAYRGRALIQNNISYQNGGAGIQAFISDHVDIVHNTTYSNSRRSIYQGSYGEISAFWANDVNVYNNVMFAEPGQAVTVGGYTSSTGKNPRTSGVNIRNNVFKYTDGSFPVGERDPVTGVPANISTRFYPTFNPNPGTNLQRLNENADHALSENNYRTFGTIWNGASTGNFTLLASSDARQRGTLVIGKGSNAELPFLPSLDLDFAPRVQGTLAAPTAKIPDAGALESPATY